MFLLIISFISLLSDGVSISLNISKLSGLKKLIFLIYVCVFFIISSTFVYQFYLHLRSLLLTY